MSQTLVISETLYSQLQATAHERGLDNLEDLIRQSFETWRARRETIQQIDALRERLFAKHGETADSVDLIRADRER
ncbi:MAG: hypothetical protein FJ009_03335 [Chloroflexi bacterium]|nr:hypothetical protein [Chloroflexota bacterium]